MDEYTYLKLLKAHQNEELYLLKAYLKSVPEERKLLLNAYMGVIEVPTVEEADYLLFTSLSGKNLVTDKGNIPIFTINNQKYSTEQFKTIYFKNTSTEYQKPYDCSAFVELIKKYNHENKPRTLSKDNQETYEKYHLLIDDPYSKPTVLIYSFQSYNFKKESIMHGFSFENNRYIKNPSPLEYNNLNTPELCGKNECFWKIISALQMVLKDYPLMEQRKILTQHLFTFVQKISKDFYENNHPTNSEIKEKVKKELYKLKLR